MENQLQCFQVKLKLLLHQLLKKRNKINPKISVLQYAKEIKAFESELAKFEKEHGLK